MKRSVQGAIGLLRWFSIAFLTTGLIACGGGGGGGGGGGPVGPSPTLAIDGANAQEVASTAYQAATGVMASGGLIVGDEVKLAPRPKSVLGRFTMNLAKTLKERQASESAATRTHFNGTFPCTYSGTYTYDSDDVTYANITFNNCSDFPGETINGLISVTVTGSGPTSLSANVSINLTFSESGFPPVTMSGGYSFSYSENATTASVSINGNSLTISDGTDTITLANFGFTYSEDLFTGDVSASVNFSLTSTGLGGTVTVTTLTPLQAYGYAAYPHAGVVEVVGANNTRCRLTVNGNESYLPVAQQVTIEVDTDGNGTFDVIINTSWAALDA